MMMSAAVFAIVNLASSIYHVRPRPEHGPKRRSTSRPMWRQAVPGAPLIGCYANAAKLQTACPFSAFILQIR